jgi:hypothetical protein
MVSLPTGPCAVLDQAIRCVEGLQFEACVPTFCLANDLSKKDINIEFKLYAIWV